MTQPELGVLPSGHLHCFLTEGDSDANQITGQVAIDTAFARSIAAGLIALAAMDNATNLSPALGYWRTFTCQYLAKRCQMTPAEQVHPDPVAALNEQQTALLLENTPPMRGAEYLSPQGLNGIWFWLDDCMHTNSPAWQSRGVP